VASLADGQGKDQACLTDTLGWDFRCQSGARTRRPSRQFV